MSPDAELVVLLAGLHIVGFAFAAVLFFVLMRADPVSPWSPPDDDGNDRTPSPRSGGPNGGGLPLPDAIQAHVRPGATTGSPTRTRLPAAAPRTSRAPSQTYRRATRSPSAARGVRGR